MQVADIELIQDRTGIQLPRFYVELVTEYPAELSQTEAVDFGLLDDPEVVIRENLEVREQGYFGEPWPHQYFIIGQNGGGDYYVIIHTAKEFSVGFADHELMECRPFAATRSKFVELLLADMTP